MCGRYKVDIENPETAELIRNAAGSCKVKNGDVRPTDSGIVLTDVGGFSRAAAMKWGYGLTSGKQIINARAESVSYKPLFAQDFCSRRCLAAANGFYEWDEKGGMYYCEAKDGALLYLAAIYRTVNGKEQFTILTKPSTAPVNNIHDRIPVIAEKDEIYDWLTDYDFALYLCGKNFDGGKLRMERAGEK